MDCTTALKISSGARFFSCLFKWMNMGQRHYLIIFPRYCFSFVDEILLAVCTFFFFLSFILFFVTAHCCCCRSYRITINVHLALRMHTFVAITIHHYIYSYNVYKWMMNIAAGFEWKSISTAQIHLHKRSIQFFTVSIVIYFYSPHNKAEHAHTTKNYFGN